MSDAKSEYDRLYAEFKQHFDQHGGQVPSEVEEAFMERVAERVRRMARRALTDEVRRAFDTNDIAGTVLRRVVGCVRQGKLRLDSEGQFMSMLGTMTKRAIIDKHDYLNSLLRDQSRTVSMSAVAGGDSALDDQGDWEPADSDRVAHHETGSPTGSPVDEVLLAEKTQALNELCVAVRQQLQADEWHVFKRRFLEDASWKEVAEEMQILDKHGRPSADATRMRVTRMLEELRPRLKKYEQWLSERPQR